MCCQPLTLAKLVLSAFFHAQEISETILLFTSNPRDIITKAELQVHWEPYPSDAFMPYNTACNLITRECKIATAVGSVMLFMLIIHQKIGEALPLGNLG